MSHDSNEFATFPYLDMETPIISNSAILILYNKSLWLIAPKILNNNLKNDICQPMMIDIELKDDENILKFYFNDKTCTILTTMGNLYVNQRDVIVNQKIPFNFLSSNVLHVINLYNTIIYETDNCEYFVYFNDEYKESVMLTNICDKLYKINVPGYDIYQRQDFHLHFVRNGKKHKIISIFMENGVSYLTFFKFTERKYCKKSFYYVPSDNVLLYLYRGNLLCLSIKKSFILKYDVDSYNCSYDLCTHDTKIFIEKGDDSYYYKNLTFISKDINCLITKSNKNFIFFYEFYDNCQTNFMIRDNIFMINSYMFQKYAITSNYMLFVEDDSLFLISNSLIKSKKCDIYHQQDIKLFNINRDGISNIFFYKFMISNVIDIINNDNDMVVIKTSDGYFYKSFFKENDNCISQTEFIKILIMDEYKIYQELPMYENYVPRYFEKVIVDIDSNYLDFSLNNFHIFSKFKRLDIYLKNRDGSKAYGDGTRSIFFQKLVNDISDKLFHTSGSIVSFRKISDINLNNTQFTQIGYILHYIICWTKTYLPIRFPIILLEFLKSNSLNSNDFEYFISQDDFNFQETLKNKNNIEYITSIGYDSYLDLLHKLCKYDFYEFSEICSLISSGFIYYKNIFTIDNINIPTLDYYLSGPVRIDRNKLFPRINIKADDREREIIMSVIRDLTDTELNILLINWSGTSSILNREYTIYVNSDTLSIFYAVCPVTIIINDKYINKNELKQLFIKSITDINDK